MANRNWTREELILALNLYLKLPFGKLDQRTPEVIRLAKLIGRTPGAMSMRLNNFASVDPYHQQRGIKGLVGGIKQVKPIWDEFISNKEDLIYESERILAEMENEPLERRFPDLLSGIEELTGETQLREVKTRVNQNVFRQIILANYSNKCAMSGISIPALLVASHIVPWSQNTEERLNPSNGICLSALHDKAFDKGFLGLDKEYKILLSPALKKRNKEEFYIKYFQSLEKQTIALPPKYHPDPRFLEFHMDTIFQK